MFDWNGDKWNDSKHSKETIGESRANEQPQRFGNLLKKQNQSKLGKLHQY